MLASFSEMPLPTVRSQDQEFECLGDPSICANPRGCACAPLPPTRVRHRGDKIDSKGRVSALCFQKPRAIDMKRATWAMSDDAVTCPKCRALILERRTVPNPTK